MVTKEILMSHPVATLKKEVAKTNIRGYSKLKKAEIIDLMLKNKDKFGHIKKKGEASAAAPKSPPKSQAQNLLAAYKPKAPATATVKNKPEPTFAETAAEYLAVLAAEKKRRGIKDKPKKKKKKDKKKKKE